MICKLKDISANNRGYYGIGAAAVDYDVNKYTYLRITDINDDGSVNKKGLMSVDNERANDYILQKNDIVFARTGASTGRNYFYDGEIDNLVYAGFLIKFSLDEKLVNPRYVKYYCLSRNYKNWISSSLTGSTRPNINEKQLAEMPILLPSREIQDKFVSIMDSITSKIELNSEINNNLLEIGISLVNKYFNEVEDYETLNNIIKFNKGKKPNDILEVKVDGYDKYLTIACLNGQELNYADSNKMLIANNDLLMVMDGASSGDIYYSDYGIVGSTLAKLDIIDENTEKEYIYFCLKKYNDLIKSKNTGSAIPHTDKVFVYSLEVPKIEKEKQQYFKILLKNIQENEKENETLFKLRDTLLPKLMNGEIDVDNIEI